jgi:hypothetical protein
MNANIAKSVIANAALNTVNTHRDREVSNGVEPASSSVAAVLALTSPPSPRLALAPIKGSRSVATIARRRARVMWIAATRGGSVRFVSFRFVSPVTSEDSCVRNNGRCSSFVVFKYDGKVAVKPLDGLSACSSPNWTTASPRPPNGYRRVARER